MKPVSTKKEARKMMEVLDCDVRTGAAAPGDIKVWWIELLRGDAKAVIYAWPEARERLVELLRGKVERIDVRKKAIIVEGVKESTYLDPAAVYWVKVYGRGTYYTEVCRRSGKTAYVYAIYFSPERP